MDVLWSVQGESLERALTEHIKCIDSLRRLHRECMDGTGKVHTTCMNVAWTMHRESMKSLGRVHGECEDMVRRKHGVCLKRSWILGALTKRPSLERPSNVLTPMNVHPMQAS
jgi:hypothetical protein